MNLRACLLAAAVSIGFVLPSAAEELAPNGGEWRHGISIFGDLKYPADFEHFDYANPEAPKGGELRLLPVGSYMNQGFLTFDTLNLFVLKGMGAHGMRLNFDTLMTRAWDEPDAMYGLAAEAAAIAPDNMSVAFRLRDNLTFHDGSKITSEDVVFTFDLLKSDGHPHITTAMRDVVSASALDDRTVLYEFEGNQVRDLPISIADLPILSKAFYSTNDFTASTLEPPLGSGPYVVSDVRQGRSISLRRNAEYWGKDLPVNKGRFNFETVQFEYFRDRTAAFEAFKAQEYTFHEEFTSRFWATKYVFPAFVDGRVKKLTTPDDRPSGTQGWFINTRRSHLSDPVVREALSHAFDFEWTNRQHFHDLYKRTQSYFENSEMKATGKPDDAELALLEPFRGEIPDGVFDKAYVPPVSNASGQDRRQLKIARDLLADAGWEVRDGVLKNASDEPFTLEFLSDTPTFERVLQPLIKNLALLGIDAKIRLVDAAQFEERLKDFDFDIITRRFSMRETPGVELRAFMGSEAAAQEGSRNLAGISSPAIDALIDKVTEATSREDLVTAARALDRVLRAGHYWIPQWYKAEHNLAVWDKFAQPEIKPKYHRGVIRLWWVDAEKEAALNQ
ncbi:ABC transporter, periplasmic substrate-binding protein [Candidatus Phaeomarinobacter ectocarpi]|uniref:ABC transporter, periplasmic substrate-binding protein n=1 Tax=Candidatus Phaeomarinibacter ectocarpi TaxID=1458461 RepID=X5MDA8_9HYPH|nr:extracellular solute-binding protein [Candidatus Phaeomarinobacter ectocarpi]CDO58294.1 ABC transporter, periplasmic substrate-binding protein [Candidatus Phaeomarinobacter ectocarpi]